MKPSLSLQFKRGCSSHTVSPAVFGSARSISLKVLFHGGTCLPKGLSFLPVFFFFGGSFHHGISTAQIRWAKRRGVAGARGRSSWHNRENLLLLVVIHPFFWAMSSTFGWSFLRGRAWCWARPLTAVLLLLMPSPPGRRDVRFINSETLHSTTPTLRGRRSF